MVFEHGFKLLDKVGEGSDGDGVLLEGGCPSKGGLGHIGQGEGDLFIVIIVHLVDK